jgi:hypothetical protein
MTSYLPVTIDGREIPAEPRSQGMSDVTAAAISAAADEYRATAMHLHATITGRDVELTAANCPQGRIVFAFGDGSADVEERFEDTPTVTHTYLTDGVFQAVLYHENGDRAALEVPINWPPD